MWSPLIVVISKIVCIYVNRHCQAAKKLLCIHDIVICIDWCQSGGDEYGGWVDHLRGLVHLYSTEWNITKFCQEELHIQ